MTLLLDSHIVIASLNDTLENKYPTHSILMASSFDTVISVASIWEIAIKSRLGKLPLKIPPDRITAYFISAGARVLDVNADHVTADLDPLPATRDPFDRLLLAQCKVEDMLLLTADRALVDHPLAARP